MPSTTRKVAEGTMIFFTRKIWISLFSGVSTLIVISSLGVYQYGLLTLAFAIIGMLTPFLDFDISTVLCSDIAGEIGKNQFSKVKRLIKDYAIMEILIGILFFLILIIFNGYVSHKYSTEIATLVKIITFLIILKAINNIYSTVFYSFSNYRYFSLIDGFESVIRLILVLIIYYTKHLNLINAAFISLISALIQTVIILPFYLKTVKPLKKIEISPEPLLKNIILKHGKFHILNQPIKSALESFRFWIIKFFINTEAVAIFNVASKLFGYINLLFNSIDAVICKSVLEHMANPIKVMDEIFRILKLGGYCLIYAPFIYPYHGNDVYKDYFRFTKGGLDLLTKKFSKKEIIKMRGSLETVFYFFPRIIYNLLKYPARFFDKLFRYKNQTSGYLVFLQK